MAGAPAIIGAGAEPTEAELLAMAGADSVADADVGEDPPGLPEGAPAVSIMFVAWSRTPTDRLVSMRIGSGPLSVVHEGEYVEGMLVATIHPEAVDFHWMGKKFRTPVQEF